MEISLTTPFDYIIYFSAVVGALGVLGGAGLGIYRVGSKFIKFVDGIQSLKTELSPNGGSSIKDAISRIELRQIRGELQQRALIDESTVPTFETDQTGLCIWINRAYVNLVGRSREECLGTGWILNVHPEDRNRVIQEWENCIKETRNFDMTYRFVDNNGDAINVKVTATVLKNNNAISKSDKEPKILGWMGFVEPNNTP